MVFADYRPYSEGDDIRNIDWGIYLRMDRLILRLFEEEADLPAVHLSWIRAVSMDHGEPRKLDYAKQRRRRTRIRGPAQPRSGQSESPSPMVCVRCCRRVAAGTRRRRSSDFLEGVARARADQSARCAAPIFLGAPRTRGVVVLVSDFLDPDGTEDCARGLAPVSTRRRAAARDEPAGARPAVAGGGGAGGLPRRARPANSRSRPRCWPRIARPSSSMRARSRRTAASTAGVTCAR